MQILQILQDEKLKENAEIEMAALKKKKMGEISLFLSKKI